MFQKILIANRGEIAVRIIRACRDLGIISVAVYSEADREALHAQIADEAICIGPANPRDSYLNMQNLISAALASGAQAIHPGFGFLSENAEFAQMAIENGIAFIGPKPQTIHLLGDKSEAKRTAIAAGVPVALGSDGAVYADQSCKHFQPIFPVKAVDTTAAGDTFTGYFIAGLAQGMEIPDILRMSAKASSIAVSRAGAVPSIPYRNEVIASLEA